MAESTRDGQLVGVLYRRLFRNLLQSILPVLLAAGRPSHAQRGYLATLGGRHGVSDAKHPVSSPP